MHAGHEGTCGSYAGRFGRYQESEIKYENKRRAQEGLPYLRPLYDTQDALDCLSHFQSVEYDQWFSIDENIDVLYTDAGHIIGSAAVHLRIKEDGKVTRLTFSGDVGRYRDIILKSPAPFDQADYIIIESTYGNSLHNNATTTPDQILEWIEKACLKKKGN